MNTNPNEDLIKASILSNSVSLFYLANIIFYSALGSVFALIAFLGEFKILEVAGFAFLSGFFIVKIHVTLSKWLEQLDKLKNDGFSK
jgi:hypothetical protein